MSGQDSEALAQQVRGPVLVPGDEEYEAETAGFQSGLRIRPAVAVGALDAEDVRAAVSFAASRSLPVRVHSTGHGRPAEAQGGMLISTRRMNEVRVDPERRTVWTGAGTRWEQVIEAAAPYGLAPLNGSAPHSGVIGYALGGGIGLLARTYGYTADHVRAIDLVTPDGTLRHVTAAQDADLFWALRGGRDGLGVVTGLETDLVPVPRLYGGALFYDAAAVSGELLTVYRDWTEGLTEELTSSLGFIVLPDIPQVPEPLRGRHVAQLRVAFTGDAAAGERLVAPMRAVGPPLIDTLREMPYTESPSIHSDPTDAHAYTGTNLMLDGLEVDAVRQFVEQAGHEAPVMCVVQLQHLGGALSRAPGDGVGNAVGHREARYSLSVLSGGEELDAPAAAAYHHKLGEPLEHRKVGRFLNFLFGESDADELRDAYEPETRRRLTEIRERYDPDGRFRTPITSLP
ncbi:FAD-binding oxidoreductase [Streptomyces sp. N2-109]|uniref:FAD-binding oxidoreductase n=1 Tax=Streptomyces gossypii TaxID=2883101 RepID=A0ABT2JQH7_9ACTN|nr:FAD-binding oxidoreductase [Streptomyces gossypii]MCT2589524.1 FAD-binding oxidoreductase [Streptomyces gossypii]